MYNWFETRLTIFNEHQVSVSHFYRLTSWYAMHENMHPNKSIDILRIYVNLNELTGCNQENKYWMRLVNEFG